MIQLTVICPKCGKSFMDGVHKISGKPSIKIRLSYAGKKGFLYLSSLYGSYDVNVPFEVPLRKIAGFRCPHCDADLKSTRKCDLCGAQMVAFGLKQGGHVQICARRGCPKHLMEFSDPKSELEAFYKSYTTSFKE